MQKEKKTLATVHVSLAETYRDCKQFDKAVQHYQHEIECRTEQEQDQVNVNIEIQYQQQRFILIQILTHSHTMTPFDGSGKQAF